MSTGIQDEIAINNKLTEIVNEIQKTAKNPFENLKGETFQEQLTQFQYWVGVAERHGLSTDKYYTKIQN